jgi:hypothetical protein
VWVAIDCHSKNWVAVLTSLGITALDHWDGVGMVAVVILLIYAVTSSLIGNNKCVIIFMIGNKIQVYCDANRHGICCYYDHYNDLRAFNDCSNCRVS